MNEKLNKLNIEYRKKWGIASHIDNTWWETYGDKVFKIGIEEGKKELASLQEKIENKKKEVNNVIHQKEIIGKKKNKSSDDIIFENSYADSDYFLEGELSALEEISKIFKEMGQ